MPRFIVHLLIFALLAIVIALPVSRLLRSDTSTRNFRAVDPGVFYRSGQMAAPGLERVLDEYGIRTVVSFRDSKSKTELAPDEFEKGLCESRGVVYHRFTPLNWMLPDGTMPAQANVDRFVKMLHDPKTQWPILIHCFAGVHRTGAFTAIYRMEKDGWTNAEAIREMLEIGRDKSGFEADILTYLNGYQPRTPRPIINSVK
ncbi:dual specificity protein phosphatase family protein [soil metagenome]